MTTSGRIHTDLPYWEIIPVLNLRYAPRDVDDISFTSLPAFWEIRFRWLKLIAFYRIYL